MKQECIKLQGIVTQDCSNANFRVELDGVDSDAILCTISGKIRKNFIKIAVGDRVELEMSPYDLTRGRITRRL